ncbi:MAG: CocE/NonD family hydrolase [Nocardioides sp.]|nr:CocE/NonD family hydrolase [Nocardioides sp.]
MTPRTPLVRALFTLAVVLSLAVATLTTVQSASGSAPPFTLRPGNTQLEVLDATTLEGTRLDLLRDGQVVHTRTVDDQGSLVWRRLRPGRYNVRTADASYTSAPVRVLSFDAPPPPQSFYDAQTLNKGFGFIQTRDGTTLSANVSFPAFGSPPYPTVVEYSGYDPSNPANTTFAQIMNGLGFAYVGVNIRGTGCSGGSFLPFEPVQSLDGYDAIETIAAQPWVKFHKVGMVGISYPGIEQLYVGRTQPPHLAAISPLSVLDDSYRATLWPGGILNTGFAEPWASQRGQDARPYGEGWEQGMVDQGYTECATNQLVRDQNPDPVSLIEDNPFYNKRYYQQIDPSRFVHKINVPVYLAGAWQDEQTGGHFPAFLNRFKSSPQLYATMSNGCHTESLSMGEFGRYADFLDLYVGRRVPTGLKSIVAPQVAAALTGVTGLSLPPQNNYQGMDYAQAKHLYQSQPHIRVLFEEGAAAGQPSGAPLPRFVRGFSSWPVPGVKATRFYLGTHGGLKPGAPKRRSKAKSFSADPTALPATDYTGSSSAIWGAHPTYDWRQIPQGTGLGWITAPMKKNLVVIGGGSLDVWVKTPARDVDLEATVSDVRPSGREVYVQSGWLRASHRRLDTRASTVLRPVHTDRRRDAREMPWETYQMLRIEIPAFAQPFRVGDRLRITLDAPGGAKPLWAFRTIDHGQKVTVGTDRRHASFLVLSAVPGVAVPKGEPSCASLRSQPCRSYPR